MTELAGTASQKIRVLIVDDEYMVLNALRDEVNWSSLGMELAAEATNGKQALEQCALHWPDLVLIDISMPVMNGLDVVKAAKADFPSIRFAILTAHPDFAYAQQALHMGALAYVLKTPVMIEDIERMLRECRETIEAERRVNARLRMADQLLNRHAWDIRRSIQQELARGGPMPDQEWKYLTDAGQWDEPAAKPYAYQALHVRIGQMNRLLGRYPERDVPLIKFALFQAVQEVFHEHGGGIALPDPAGCLHVIRRIPATGSRAESEVQLQSIGLRLSRFVRQYFGAAVSIGISAAAEDKHLIPSRFKEAAIASSLSFYKPSAVLHYYHDAKKLDVKMEDWAETENALLSRWHKGTPEAAEQGLRLLEQYIRDHHPDPGLLRKKTVAALEKSGIRLTRHDWLELGDDHPLPEWLERLKDLLCRMQAPLPGIEASPELHEDIGKAIAYMKQHLQDNLSLTKVAEQVPLNPSYFSHLFKLNTGSTFIDYLTGLRIERAKQLLLQPEIKSYRLCELIGIASYPHFCTLFKKLTGMTPSEYKQQSKGAR